MTSLLKKAKSIKPRRNFRRYTFEDVELAVAWLDDKVKTGQVIDVLGIKAKSGGAVYNYIANALRKGIRNGNVKVIMISNKETK